MPQIALNKTSLQNLNKDLDTYRQFLPTLDLKRKQLLAEQVKTRNKLENVDAQLKKQLYESGELLGTLAMSHVSLRRIVSIGKIEVLERNIVGVTLPEPGKLSFSVAPYNVPTSPIWIEFAIKATKQLVSLKVHADIWKKRLSLINRAVQKTSQRLNLFEKVLIPETSQAIRKIELFLADEDTAAVVRSKLAKRKLSSGEKGLGDTI